MAAGAARDVTQGHATPRPRRSAPAEQPAASSPPAQDTRRSWKLLRTVTAPPRQASASAQHKYRFRTTCKSMSNRRHRLTCSKRTLLAAPVATKTLASSTTSLPDQHVTCFRYLGPASLFHRWPSSTLWGFLPMASFSVPTGVLGCLFFSPQLIICFLEGLT